MPWREVALAQKPLEVAVGGRADAFAPQGGFLRPSPVRVGLVALLAVIAIEKRPGVDGFGIAGQRV